MFFYPNLCLHLCLSLGLPCLGFRGRCPFLFMLDCLAGAQMRVIDGRLLGLQDGRLVEFPMPQAGNVLDLNAHPLMAFFQTLLPWVQVNIYCILLISRVNVHFIGSTGGMASGSTGGSRWWCHWRWLTVKLKASISQNSRCLLLTLASLTPRNKSKKVVGKMRGHRCP